MQSESPAEQRTRGDRAFLRWVGGKRNLVSRLLPFFPHDIKKFRYHEPFAGAASLFFAVAPESATLSDLNGHLIGCYREIRKNPKKVATLVRSHERANSSRYYYRIREIYNRAKDGPAQAARFIYLNRTCFNGVFRVNRDGKFNVPYGDKPNPTFPSLEVLNSVGLVLKNAKLQVSDYEVALANVGANEFVYLDPPYPPLNGTAFFTHYTADRFDSENQLRLANAVRKLHSRGARFLMTNADLPIIRDLYKDFNISELSVTRYVSCKGARHQVGELVIANYKHAK